MMSVASRQRIFGRLLRPVLKLCLTHGVLLRELVEIIKITVADLAQEQLKNSGQPVSVTKISLMTGVHRKDITELLTLSSPREPAVSVFARAIGQWQTNKRYQTPQGKPRPLHAKGKDSEFARLVASIQTEMNPYSVLFELKRVGAVEEHGEFVYLKTLEYALAEDIEQGFNLVAADLRDIISAAEYNISSGGKDPHLHLTTSFDNVTPEGLDVIRKWCMAEGAKIHKRARHFFSKFDKDVSEKLKDKNGGGRVVLGTFGFTEKAADLKKTTKNLRKSKD